MLSPIRCKSWEEWLAEADISYPFIHILKGKGSDVNCLLPDRPIDASSQVDWPGIVNRGEKGLFDFLRERRLFLGISVAPIDEQPRKVLRHMGDVLW